MEALLTSPSGKSDACEVRDTAGHIYDIRFVPEEDGLHHVSIKYKGIHITGRQTVNQSSYIFVFQKHDTNMIG